MEKYSGIVAITFSKVMKQKRIEKGFTQEMIAEYLGLTRMSIINMEAGRHRPHIENLYEIACILDCSVSDFFPAIKKVKVSETTITITRQKTKRTLCHRKK